MKKMKTIKLPGLTMAEWCICALIITIAMVVLFGTPGCGGAKPTPPIRVLVDPSADIAAGAKLATDLGGVAEQGRAATPTDLHPTLDPFWDAIVKIGKDLTDTFKKMTVTAANQKQQFVDYQKWSEQRFADQDAMYAKAEKDLNAKLKAEKDGKEDALDKLGKEQTKRAAAEAEYHDSWLGGKTWRLIFWIVGCATALLVADTLLFLFTGTGTLNPLTIVISLVGGLFKKKAA